MLRTGELIEIISEEIEDRSTRDEDAVAPEEIEALELMKEKICNKSTLKHNEYEWLCDLVAAHIENKNE